MLLNRGRESYLSRGELESGESTGFGERRILGILTRNISTAPSHTCAPSGGGGKGRARVCTLFISRKEPCFSTRAWIQVETETRDPFSRGSGYKRPRKFEAG